MVVLPIDWSSFLWGAVVGGGAAFATGILKKAGEQAYAAIHRRMFPEPPEPIEVDRKFLPSLYRPGTCAWVSELDVNEFEDKGYTHYPIQAALRSASVQPPMVGEHSRSF